LEPSAARWVVEKSGFSQIPANMASRRSHFAPTAGHCFGQIQLTPGDASVNMKPDAKYQCLVVNCANRLGHYLLKPCAARR